jgi:microsomal dipeptidase-like Zn-dependent dipeptidase
VFSRRTYVIYAVAAIAALLAAISAAAAVWLGSAGGHATSPARSRGSRVAVEPRRLANSCFALSSAATHRYLHITGSSYRAVSVRPAATPFYLKPTGLGTYLVFDREARLLSARGSGSPGRAVVPSPSTEWAIRHVSGPGFALSLKLSHRPLIVRGGGQLALGRAGAGGAAPAAEFEFVTDHGCRDYPEAQVGAFGRPFRRTGPGGKVFGFVDLHVHITANMRAGGALIYGESFDRYGIPEALSAAGDARLHGAAGNHYGWPKFTGWPTYNTITHQQVYYVWLKRAWMGGLRLAVAQTVDDRPLCEMLARRDRTCDETKSIVGQVMRLYAMQDYIDAQSGGSGRGWFRLVFDPAQARRVIAQGKLAVVLGIESSDLFGCSEFRGRPQCTKAQIDRGLDLYHRLGVRTLFPVHWIDNAFGGAALEGGGQGQVIAGLQVAQTGQRFRTAPCSQPGEIEQPASGGVGPICNSEGLTSLGAYAIRQMMARHMMIEADHMSEIMRNSVIAIAQAHHYPLVSSHNGTGGSWSPTQLAALYRLGGIVAVTPDAAPRLAAKILALQRYRRPGQYFGVGLGTDTGGLGSLPAPREDAAQHPLRYPFRSYDGNVEFVRERTGDFSYDLNTDGVAQYGLLPDLIADIQQGHGDARALPFLFRSAEAYLETWQRAMQAK